jgi:hypothetical protein
LGGLDRSVRDGGNEVMTLLLRAKGGGVEERGKMAWRDLWPAWAGGIPGKEGETGAGIKRNVVLIRHE